MVLKSKSEARLRAALEAAGRGERLDRSEGLSLAGLVNPAGIFRLRAAAMANRTRRFGQGATYVYNLQINPSNICEGTCRFCRYRAGEGDPGAYALSESEILGRVDALRPTEVHIVGGMNRIWHFERSLALIAAIRQRYGDIHIKAYTAVEIDFFARQSGLGRRTVLERLRDAGLDALPGGGAELFSRRMREIHCPDKLSAEGWIDVHKIAHELGIGTNGTMLYGLEESLEELIDHLLLLREAEDDAPGFSCFIPLPFQPGAGDVLEGPPPLFNLGVIALSRLMLDNVPHIKAYWPMTGLETASAALSFGADDLDGTIGEERIAHAAGAKTPKALSREKMATTIRLGGFEPIERDGRFAPIRERGAE